MTDQEINATIANELGWKYDPRGDKYGPTVYAWISPQGKRDPGPPTYVTDLNAMHEAEKVLTPEQEESYVVSLGALIMGSAYDVDSRWEKSNLSSFDSTYRATARQRAEAFLRTLGKWKE